MLQELLAYIVVRIVCIPIIMIGIGICYPIGAVALLFFSWGRISPGPIDFFPDGTNYRRHGMKWWHLIYLEEGDRCMPSEGVALIGLLCIGFLTLCVYRIVYAFTG